MRHSVRLLGATLLALTPLSSAAQQDLIILGRLNRFWQLQDFDGPNPSLVELDSLQCPPGASVCSSPAGLTTDRATGDLLVLMSDWTQPENATSEIWRIDRTTWETTVEAQLEAPEGETHGRFTGLEQQPSGRLITVFCGSDSPFGVQTTRHLAIVDASRSSTDFMILRGLDEELTSQLFLPLTLDSRGVPIALVHSLSDLTHNVEIDLATGVVSEGSLSAPEFLSWGLVQSNAGESYAADSIGRFSKLDPATGDWNLVFNGQFYISYLWDMTLTNSSVGNDFEVVCSSLPNSNDQVSTLEFIGSSAVSENDLTLVARNVPLASTGFYLMGEIEAITPLGLGLLCIHSPIHRDLGSLNHTGGTFAYSVDLGALANGQPAIAGTRQIFQYWHRDFENGMPTTSLSDAIAVTFR